MQLLSDPQVTVRYLTVVRAALLCCTRLFCFVLFRFVSFVLTIYSMYILP